MRVTEEKSGSIIKCNGICSDYKCCNDHFPGVNLHVIHSKFTLLVGSTNFVILVFSNIKAKAVTLLIRNSTQLEHLTY